jgi:hypothetical protein
MSALATPAIELITITASCSVLLLLPRHPQFLIHLYFWSISSLPSSNEEYLPYQNIEKVLAYSSCSMEL